MRFTRFRFGSRTRGAASLAAATAATMVCVAHPTAADDRRGPDRYSVGLFGDMPYNAMGRAQYPALLQDINQSHVAFSIFDGDLDAGGDGPCADSLYTTAIQHFNMLERPLVWVPGDNDWTDCWGRYGPAT